MLVNGQDLHAHFDALKHDIAVVPQRDILHDSLSRGRRALVHRPAASTARPRSAGEVEACVGETLDTVSLLENAASPSSATSAADRSNAPAWPTRF